MGKNNNKIKLSEEEAIKVITEADTGIDQVLFSKLSLTMKL